MIHFITLTESSGGPLLVNTSDIITASEGKFKGTDCTWVRLRSGHNQAVSESLKHIISLLQE